MSVIIKKHINFLFVIILWVMFIGAVNADDYLIRQGDTLDISVWGDETLSKEIHVLPDGSISFPLAGKIYVAGKSSTTIETKITDKLKKYLTDPEVTVIITATAGSRIYVLGKVQTPGPIPLTGPITVLHALSIAGGFTRFADQGAIKILRNTSKGNTVLPVDYEALLKGDNLNTNYVLQADDTILVP